MTKPEDMNTINADKTAFNGDWRPIGLAALTIGVMLFVALCAVFA